MTYPAVSRGPLSIDVLLWIEAKNRETGVTETLGLWTGSEDRQFLFGSVTRLYHGAGTVLGVDDLVSRVGVGVQMQSARLGLLAPEVEDLIRGYDARQAPVEIHIARFDPENHGLLDVTRVFKGWLDHATVSDGAKGGNASLVARLASSARSLTRRVPLRRSDTAQQAAHPGDAFLRYADVSGAVSVWWGMKRQGGGGRRGPGFSERVEALLTRPGGG